MLEAPVEQEEAGEEKEAEEQGEAQNAPAGAQRAPRPPLER